ncbi:GTP pyrophosphokinase family protein [Corynebacterium sp.]|uniref:GTP pyrophosphokinase n=1 Tax=Corynebacterium sp. TaxID=1720 RepID=UPI0026DA8382|nr:GTP pyrophosphokinase family protein [Corynebacterium sp.]MDO5075890.1 GTP pyrophosphokinase family protein [Corynebacterium sp.]
MNTFDQAIARLDARYHEFVAKHPAAAADFREAVEDLLVDSGVTYDRVTTRVKEWRSLHAKAQKRSPEGTPSYPDPWHDIHDIIGVRVTTYHSTEIPAVVSVLQDSFHVIRSVDKAAETRISGGFGYGSHHVVIKVPENHQELADYRGMVFEVQVRTVLQHAWAEFEHDIRYKNPGGSMDPRIDRAFTLAAGLIELADQQFDQIAAIQGAPPTAQADDVALSAETLPGVLSVLIGNRFARSKSESYRWLEEILAANGITTVAQLKQLLNDVDVSKIEHAMRYRFKPGHVRIIDDALLRKFGNEHIKRTTKGRRGAARATRLRDRLQTMHLNER